MVLEISVNKQITLTKGYCIKIGCGLSLRNSDEHVKFVHEMFPNGMKQNLCLISN